MIEEEGGWGVCPLDPHLKYYIVDLIIQLNLI